VFLPVSASRSRRLADFPILPSLAKCLTMATVSAKYRILISIMTIVEIMYLSERNRIPVDLSMTRQKIENLSNYAIVELDMEIVEKAKTIHGLELHDRLIVASALSLNIPILSSDKAITDAKVVNVIWA
jgi:PIN domain nuclease of toxin-antitoxin system